MRIFVAGGAGFIGSHVVNQFLSQTDGEAVVFDNFSSGQPAHLEPHLDNPRLKIVTGDLKDLPAVTDAIKGADRVYHFASNPDIAKAMTQPDVDFWEGTYLTQNLLEAIRVNRIKELIYASGSGVYGDVGDLAVTEDHSPMLPISPYGASKLSCEALVHTYSFMFDLRACIFRFANVVGDHQTHGVAYDFIRKLREEPGKLRILGDGTQSKSYIHVDDIVNALEYFVTRMQGDYEYYHLATADYLTVREIADLVVEELGLSGVQYDFTGGKRGWKGDVPVVRFNLAKVNTKGWRAARSAREAMRASIRSMMQETSGSRPA